MTNERARIPARFCCRRHTSDQRFKVRIAGRTMSKIRALVYLPLLLGFVGSAHAASGSPREFVQYRDVLKKIDFTCPRGSSRRLQEHDQKQVEGCYDHRGKPTGYFIQWQADGKHWLKAGHYRRGIPHGVWMKFNPEGKPDWISTYQNGRRVSHRPFEADDREPSSTLADLKPVKPSR